MKKIEKGCTAIICNGLIEENIGKIVTVGNFIGKIPLIEYKKGYAILEGDDWWEVNKPMGMCDIHDNKKEIKTYIYFQQECNLQRLDDEEDINNKEEEILIEETI